MKDRPLTDFDRTVLGQMEQIRAIGRKRLHNQNELDDFVQETIARAYANRSRLRDPAKLKQWIAGVARNTANEWNRAFDRMKREQPLQDEIGIQDEIDPLDALEQAERNEQIREAMGRLSPADRDLLRGRYLDEESYAELQKRHGLSYSAVGIRLHRAKRRLKKILNRMKIALVLPLANLKRSAFGGILFMTKTTKIVLSAAAVLILALLGAYLWLEYGGSPDEAEPGLTLEEQSPRVNATGSNRAGASTDTGAPDNADAAQTSEAATANDSGETSETATQTPGDAANAPDEFSNKLQEGIQELEDYAARLRAEEPVIALIGDANLATADEIAELDAQLRRQEADVEERRKQLFEKYISISRAHTAALSEAILYVQTFDDSKLEIITQRIGDTPTKLMDLLSGGMSQQEIYERIVADPEVRARMQEVRAEMEAMKEAEERAQAILKLHEENMQKRQNDLERNKP